MLEFSYNSKKGASEYYVCTNCKVIKNSDKTLGVVPRVTIQAKRFKTNPDYLIADHFCSSDIGNASSIGTILAVREIYSACKSIRTSKRKPKTILSVSQIKVGLPVNLCKSRE
jgi:hypothetical protein